MDFLAQVAQAAGKEQLHLRVDIFHVVFHLEVAGLDGYGDVVEAFEEKLQLVVAEQADVRQHPDMGLGAFDVVGGEPQVEDPVVSDGETVDDFRGSRAFIP